MTPNPRTIILHIGRRKIPIEWPAPDDAPPAPRRFEVMRYWLAVLSAAVRAWLYAHAMPVLFAALGLLLAAALVVGALALR
jgi:hypothetical protein